MPKFKDIVLNNRRLIGQNGHFRTLAEAVTWFNAFAADDMEFILDSGEHMVYDTLTILPSVHKLMLRGASETTSSIVLGAGMLNKPLFDIQTSVTMTMLHMDASQLAGYGALDTENALCFTTDSGVRADIMDIKATGFYYVACDTAGIGLNIHDFDIIDCTCGICIDHINVGYTAAYIRSGRFTDCDVDISLKSAPFCNLIIDSLHFRDTTTACIQYDGAHFVYSPSSVVMNCVHDGSGAFETGFDWALARDANIDFHSNVGYSDNRPRAVAYVVDTATPTTVTLANTFYTIPFATTTDTVYKMDFTGNLLTYLSSELKDGRFTLFGNILQDTGIGRILTVAVRKNGTDIISSMHVRARERNIPYTFSLYGFSHNVAKDDWFEVVVSSDVAGDLINILDLHYHFDTV